MLGRVRPQRLGVALAPTDDVGSSSTYLGRVQLSGSLSGTALLFNIWREKQCTFKSTLRAMCLHIQPLPSICALSLEQDRSEIYEMIDSSLEVSCARLQPLWILKIQAVFTVHSF